MRRVSLFRNGANQAVRIPREFELPTTEAILIRDGNRLILEPCPPDPSLASTLAGLKPIRESFPDVDETLPDVDTIELQ